MSEKFTGATGIGSWPGESVPAALRVVFDQLAAEGIPYLPELPARGPGADMIGRTASLLVDLPVDLQPSGWRFVDRPGRDQERAASYLRSDLDALAEVAHDYRGPLKVQVCGPWTLMSAVNLQRGERTVADPGARRDVVESLAEGVRNHLDAVRAQVPGAQLVVQFDEPAIRSVLEGRLPTQSGVGRIRAVEAAEVTERLRYLIDAAREAGAVTTAIHCCDRRVPFAALRGTGVDALSVDISLLGPPGWESVAVCVEDGLQLWAGVVPSTAPEATPSVKALADSVTTPWRQVGLPAADLSGVAVTPACGLAGASPTWAATAGQVSGQVAQALVQVAGE